MITKWRKIFFLLSNAINGNNYSIIEGEWRLGEALQVTFVNMYNSGSLSKNSNVGRGSRKEKGDKYKGMVCG